VGAATAALTGTLVRRDNPENTEQVQMREVTIRGQKFRLDQGRVRDALAGQLPEPLHEHYVVVDGRRYPPKQVIAAVTGLDRADFTTHQARRILTRLGFAAARHTPKETGPPAPGQAWHGSSRAEALRPFVGRWVAIRGEDVLVAADTPTEVVSWLNQYGQRADSMFRVPADEVSAGGAAPA